MNKLRVYIAFLALATIVSSCNKEWVCVCTNTVNNGVGEPKVNYIHTKIKGSKGLAKDECNVGDGMEKDGIFISVTECSLAE